MTTTLAKPLQGVIRLYVNAFSGFPRPVWNLSVAMLVNRSGAMVLPFLALFLRNERGLSIAGTGWVMSAYGTGAIFGSYFGGWLSDRIGSTRTQQLSLALSGVAFLAIPRVSGTLGLVAVIVVASFVTEAFRPACMAAVASHTTAETKARAFALLRLAANLGLAVGPAIGGILAMRSYEWLFLCDAATCWAAAILLARGLGVTDAGKGGRLRGGATGGIAPWRDGPFLMILLLTLLTICAFFQLFTTVPLYYQERFGLREAGIGALFATNAGLIVLFEMVLVHALEKAPRMPIVAAGCFLMCAGLALMPFGTSIAWVLATVVVWTLGEMLALPFLSVVVANRAGPGRIGSYMGLYATTFAAAFVFGPAVGGSVYERAGPDVLWYAIGLLGVALAAFAWIAGRRLGAETAPRVILTAAEASRRDPATHEPEA